MKKVILFGGNFGPDQGRISGYMVKFANAISKMPEVELTAIHGGSVDYINSYLNPDMPLNIGQYDIVLWFPNISNDEEKTVSSIKKKFPKIILVASKNNRDGKYFPQDLISRMLSVKSNLCLEFLTAQVGPSPKIAANLLDPLGNAFITGEIDIPKIARAVITRSIQLCEYTRMGSKSIGTLGGRKIPDDPRFFEAARKRAEEFHSLIHPAEGVARFLGNLSFRCEKGFPSYRGEDGFIFVTRRNVDKCAITQESFVPARLEIRSMQSVHNSTPVSSEVVTVGYLGDVKPSVDTPVQVALYHAYKNVNYMIHSHVYVKDGIFTEEVIPCGALEEAIEILRIQPDRDLANFSINLLGHGSIVFSRDLDYLESRIYMAREIPEIQPLRSMPAESSMIDCGPEMPPIQLNYVQLPMRAQKPR